MGHKWLRVRLLLAAGVLTGLFGALAWKAWALQIRDGAHMRALGLKQVLQELILPAPRGAIRDSNGVELAVTVDVDSAFVNPREVVDVAASAGRLAPVLSMDVRELEERLASARRFEWLKRHVSPDEARAVRELSLPGIGLVAEPRRFYPLRDLAGPVLGFANIDGKGIEGIELALDSKLRGQRASLPVMRDRRGDIVIPGEVDDTAVPGATVTLTIDKYLQFSAERALADGVRENKAKAGIAIVMDPRNGEILAMASSPGYDPNEPDEKDPLAHDRPVTDAYEPGSVMKVFSVSAALEAGAVRPDDVVDVEGGRLQVGKHVITDTHHGLGLISIGEVIKVSSNVGAVKIARKLGKERLAAQYLRFGFGARTGIDMPGESPGRVRNPATWGESGLATASYGYGLQTTPLQIAAALAAIANGGTWHQPSIVKRITAADGKVLWEHAAVSRRVLTEQAAAQMTAMMKMVMEKGGTGDTVKLPGFTIAGKTGTAYKHDPVTKRYAADRYLASFVGFVPADDPRLLIVVMIDEPRAGKHFGAQVSAPVFVAIAGEGLRYLGVAGDPEAAAPPRPAAAAVAVEEVPAVVDIPEIDEDGDSPPAGPGEPIVMIPDFKGLSVAQALAAARAAGVKVEIQGTGRALRQFPPPGRALKSITCHVTFNPG